MDLVCAIAGKGAIKSDRRTKNSETFSSCTKKYSCTAGIAYEILILLTVSFNLRPYSTVLKIKFFCRLSDTYDKKQNKKKKKTALQG